MSANLSRRQLTDAIIDAVATTTNKPVGDATFRHGMGWQGQPNASGSNFIPYNIVIPGTANRSSGPFDDSQADWQLPYVIWGFGVTRDQCEAICDLARNSLSDMKGDLLDLGDQKYSVQQIRTESIGSVNRYDLTDPPYYGQMDSVTVWLTKELQ